MRNGNENGCLSLGMDVINWIVLGSKKNNLVLVKNLKYDPQCHGPDRLVLKRSVLQDRSGVRRLVLENFARATGFTMRTSKYHLKKGLLFSAETCSKWSL